MSIRESTRFELRRLSSFQWQIEDLSLSESHSRRVVGQVYEVDDLEYDVVWRRDLGLAEHYMSPADALQAVVDEAATRRRSTAQRPIPIPHVPPIRERVPA